MLAPKIILSIYSCWIKIKYARKKPPQTKKPHQIPLILQLWKKNS